MWRRCSSASSLAALAAQVLIGALMPDEKSAAVVGPLFLALSMLSGGLFVQVQI